MQKIFPEARDYKTRTLKMTPERIGAIERALGEALHASERREFDVYDIVGEVRGKPEKLGTIMALAGKGEYGAIEVVIGVDPSGKVLGAYIQRSRERATKALQAPEFLEQFAGKTQKHDFNIGKGIKPAGAGAEAASQVVSFVIKKMLVFHDVLTETEKRP